MISPFAALAAVEVARDARGPRGSSGTAARCPGSTCQACADCAEEIVWKMLGVTGAVAHIWPRTGTIGISRPSIAPSGPHQAPAASTSAPATIVAARRARDVAAAPARGVERASPRAGSARGRRGARRASANARVALLRIGLRAERRVHGAEQRRREARLDAARLARRQQLDLVAARPSAPPRCSRTNSYCSGVWIACNGARAAGTRCPRPGRAAPPRRSRRCRP